MTIESILNEILLHPGRPPFTLENGITLGSHRHDKWIVIEMSRPKTLPTADELQQVMNFLAEALQRPGPELLATEAGNATNKRHIYVPRSYIRRKKQ